MAKYILLAFDNETDAETLLNEIRANSVNSPGIAIEPGEFVKCTVRGVWKRPTKFCECTSKKGFTRGRKYGWWCCANCGKPREAWAKGDHWYTSLGLNLLPISETAPENRGPEHRNHPGYQPRAVWCPLHGYQARAQDGATCPGNASSLCVNTLTISPADQPKGEPGVAVQKEDTQS